MSTETQRYSSVAKALHWLIAVMIIVQIPTGFIMHNLAFSETKYTMYQLHKSFGLIVLTLSLLRLGWRLTHKAPALPDHMKPWERVLARITHVGFYALIIGIPLTGWLMVSASPLGIDTKIFYVIPVPHWPVPVGEAAESFWIETHEVLAKITIGLLVLHVGGALKHHFVDKDSVLLRMVPSALHSKLRRDSSPKEAH
ncbi:cytochrome b [Parvularcula maris]|uniref:Cytochrome b n=1 Tax=Parvularcula maris TaxID=2965077 RepID=A0A9X2L9F6_9PROT|nr:cytochrome b [Parvularcula maris]MCQ8185379.1 cytochrome b [Parvularcula maris]